MMECRALASTPGCRAFASSSASSSAARGGQHAARGARVVGTVKQKHPSVSSRARLFFPTKTTVTGQGVPRRGGGIGGAVLARAAAPASDASSSSPLPPLRMIVLRHSDSCTEDASLKDHDRPITVWGRTLAAELGKNLVAIGWASPDLVLCSASARSRETLRELANVGHTPPSCGAGAGSTLLE